MLVNIALGLILVVLTILLAWLALRTWRARNALVKWGGGVLSSLLTLVAGVVTVVALIGLYKGYAPRNAPVPDLRVAGTPEQIQRGEYLANSFCTSCHSGNGELPLTGGLDLGEDLPLPLGKFVSVNLTPAGPLKDWSDGEIFRALRNGIDKDGRWLTIMSNVRVRRMADEDILALIAFLRSQPAVVNETPHPPDQATFMGVLMLGAGMLPEGQPPISGVISTPAKGPTVEYGEYIVSYQDCRDCHGEDLRGGVQGQLAPIGPPLAMVKSWTAEQFITTLRTGVDPSGHQVIDTMPWKQIGRLDDVDLTAMYQYLISLP
jgi:mono/diheme cytochrome c family protein